MELVSLLPVGLDNQHLQTSTGKVPTSETKKKEGGRRKQREAIMTTA